MTCCQHLLERRTTDLDKAWDGESMLSHKAEMALYWLIHSHEQGCPLPEIALKAIEQLKARCWIEVFEQYHHCTIPK